MATNLAIDENLLKEAQTIGRMPTKKETVNTALMEFIRRRKVAAVIDSFGTIDLDEDYDYKRGRTR